MQRTSAIFSEKKTTEKSINFETQWGHRRRGGHDLEILRISFTLSRFFSGWFSSAYYLVASPCTLEYFIARDRICIYAKRGEEQGPLSRSLNVYMYVYTRIGNFIMNAVGVESAASIIDTPGGIIIVMLLRALMVYTLTVYMRASLFSRR